MRPATDGDEPGIRRRLIFVSPNGEEFGAADSRHLDAQVDHLCRSLPLHAASAAVALVGLRKELTRALPTVSVCEISTGGK